MVALKRILPDNFEYEIEKQFSRNNDFEAVIRLKCKNEDELLQWKRDLEQKTGTSWIVRSTYPNATQAQFHKDYVCRHSGHKK